MAETDPMQVRLAALKEAADLCKREADAYLRTAEVMTGRDKKDRRAKAAAADHLRRQIQAMIDTLTNPPAPPRRR